LGTTTRLITDNDGDLMRVVLQQVITGLGIVSRDNPVAIGESSLEQGEALFLIIYIQEGIFLAISSRFHERNYRDLSRLQYLINSCQPGRFTLKYERLAGYHQKPPTNSGVRPNAHFSNT
jgi:hypothetical protein